jgi:hypothetical protein
MAAGYLLISTPAVHGLQVQAMDAERQQALQQAATAAANAACLQETVKELEWKCTMLQQLADMTLQQNEEKMNALRQLLNTESLLDDDEGGAVSDMQEDALSELNLSNSSSPSTQCSP